MNKIASRLFKAKMLEFNDDYSTLANVLNIHAKTVSNKISPCGTQEFTLQEVKTLIKRYNLSQQEAYKFFLE